MTFLRQHKNIGFLSFRHVNEASLRVYLRVKVDRSIYHPSLNIFRWKFIISMIMMRKIMDERLTHP